MPGGVSQYERLLIDALLLAQPNRPIEPGVGLFIGPVSRVHKAVFDLAVYTAHVPAIFERLHALTSDREAAHV